MNHFREYKSLQPVLCSGLEWEATEKGKTAAGGTEGSRVGEAVGMRGAHQKSKKVGNSPNPPSGSDHGSDLYSTQILAFSSSRIPNNLFRKLTVYWLNQPEAHYAFQEW